MTILILIASEGCPSSSSYRSGIINYVRGFEEREALPVHRRGAPRGEDDVADVGRRGQPRARRRPRRGPHGAAIVVALVIVVGPTQDTATDSAVSAAVGDYDAGEANH